MTQQITRFDFDFTLIGGSANAFTIALMRTPVALTLAQMFAAPGDQTLLYSRTYKSPTEVADRKQFPFGFGAPSGWYCNVGEELRLTAFALTPGIHPVNIWVFGSVTYDFLQTFRQMVNR
jgi:hypothetical protein